MSANLRYLDTGTQLPNVPWPLRSRRRALACSAGIGAGVFATAFFIERYLHEQGENPLAMIFVSDVLAGALAAFLVVRVFYGIIDRRFAIIERLRAIADVNHRVRNGLEIIQFSAQATQDSRAISAIREGVDRVETALREMTAPVTSHADTSNRSSFSSDPPPTRAFRRVELVRRVVLSACASCRHMVAVSDDAAVVELAERTHTCLTDEQHAA